MKIIAANRDGDGFYNYQVQLDETIPLSPIKSFKYSPFVTASNETETNYISRIEIEIKIVSSQLKATWIAQGSPTIGFVPEVTKITTILPSQGLIF